MKKKSLIILTCIFTVILACCVFLTRQAKSGYDKDKSDSLRYVSSLSLEYANQFSVDYYEGGYALIDIKESGRFLVVPKDKEVPADMEDDIVAIKQPLNNIYLVATSAMDLFVAIDKVNSIKLSGTNADGWYIEEAKAAMEKGEMLYAGKYNAPDYELILENNCDLAIESTMIYHSPEVKEQLEQFGIPVMVERSSYESHPLGRLEWIKLYGVLLGKEKQAEEYFTEATKNLEEIISKENTEKTVAFFHITSSGLVNVRKSNDYIANMIKLSGGRYIFDELENDNSLSTMNMEIENFFAKAKDADYIIYNSAIDGEIDNIEQLFDKSELLKEFKAVKNNNVWCTEKSMFQETTSISDFMMDMHKILTEDDVSDEDMNCLYKIQ